tara:strand:- start:659 stop:820 length:162 start_codon:yes stop_codon:yes gene_type:complete
MQRKCKDCDHPCHCVQDNIVCECKGCMCEETDDVGSFATDLSHHNVILNKGKI